MIDSVVPKLALLATHTHTHTQFAAAAVVPAPFSDPRQCALTVVDAIKGNVLVFADQLEARFDALKATYEQCNALPDREAVLCLRAFAQYAISVVQGLEPELEAYTILLRQYALARLEDYYLCRNGAATVFVPQVLCALRIYEDAREKLQPLTAEALARFDVLEERFLYCRALPEDLQATCIVSMFRQAVAIWQVVSVELLELRPVIEEKALVLLEDYNDCRLA